MTTPLHKEVARLLTLRSSVKGMPDKDWIVTIRPDGIRFRMKHKESGYRLTWYEVLGFAIGHGK